MELSPVKEQPTAGSGVSNNRILYDNLIKSKRATEDELGDFDSFNEMLGDSINAVYLYRNLIKHNRFTEKELGDQNDFLLSVDPFIKPVSKPEAAAAQGNMAVKPAQAPTPKIPQAPVAPPQAGPTVEEATAQKGKPLSKVFRLTPEFVQEVNKKADYKFSTYPKDIERYNSFDKEIMEAALDKNEDPNLIKFILFQETRMQKQSKPNPKGYQGLAQTNQDTIDTINRMWGTSYSIDDMNDPYTAALYIADYIKYARSMGAKTNDDIVVSYNRGIGHIKTNQAGGKHPKETQQYKKNADAIFELLDTAEFSEYPVYLQDNPQQAQQAAPQVPAQPQAKATIQTPNTKTIVLPEDTDKKTIAQIREEYLKKTRGEDYKEPENKPKEKGNGMLTEFMKKAERNVNTFSQNLIDAPNLFRRILYYPVNKFYKAVGLPEFTEDDFNKLVPMAQNMNKLYDNKTERLSKEILQLNPNADKSLTQSAKEGNWGEFSHNLAGAVVENTPTTIALMFSYPLRGFQAIAGGSLVFGSGKMRELDKKAPDMPEGMKLLVSSTNGALEMLFERTFGSGAVGKSIANLVSKEGRQAGQKAIMDGMRNGFAALLTKYPLLAPLGEGYEEWATQVSQNYIDKISGYRPDVSIFEGAFDALILGVASGSAHSGVLFSLKGIGKLATPKTTDGSNPQPAMPQGYTGPNLFGGDPTDPQGGDPNEVTGYTVGSMEKGTPRTDKELELRYYANKFKNLETGKLTTIMEPTNGYPKRWYVRTTNPVDGSIMVVDEQGNSKWLTKEDQLKNAQTIETTEDEFVAAGLEEFDLREKERETLKNNQIIIDGKQYTLTGQKDEDGHIAYDLEGNETRVPSLLVEQIRTGKYTTNEKFATRAYGKNTYTGTLDEGGFFTFTDPIRADQLDELERDIRETTGGEMTLDVEELPRQHPSDPKYFTGKVIPQTINLESEMGLNQEEEEEEIEQQPEDEEEQEDQQSYSSEREWMDNAISVLSTYVDKSYGEWGKTSAYPDIAVLMDLLDQSKTIPSELKSQLIQTGYAILKGSQKNSNGNTPIQPEPEAKKPPYSYKGKEITKDRAREIIELARVTDVAALEGLEWQDDAKLDALKEKYWPKPQAKFTLNGQEVSPTAALSYIEDVAQDWDGPLGLSKLTFENIDAEPEIRQAFLNRAKELNPNQANNEELSEQTSQHGEAGGTPVQEGETPTSEVKAEGLGKEEVKAPSFDEQEVAANLEEIKGMIAQGEDPVAIVELLKSNLELSQQKDAQLKTPSTVTVNLEELIRRVEGLKPQPEAVPELTKEQHISQHNQLVSLADDYNSTPSNHTKKRGQIFTEINRIMQRLGDYTYSHQNGVLQIQKDGKKISRIGTRQATDVTNAHKALAEYDDDVKTFIQALIDTPSGLTGIDLNTTQPEQAIRNIIEGKKTVAANDALDALEAMFKTGMINLAPKFERGRQITPAVSVPIDEYFAIFNEPLSQDEKDAALQRSDDMEEHLWELADYYSLSTEEINEIFNYFIDLENERQETDPRAENRNGDNGEKPQEGESPQGKTPQFQIPRTAQEIEALIKALEKEKADLTAKNKNLPNEANERNGLFGDIQADPNSPFAVQGFDPSNVSKIIKENEERIAVIDQELTALNAKLTEIRETAEKEKAGQLDLFGNQPVEKDLRTYLNEIAEEFGQNAKTLVKDFVERMGVENVNLQRLIDTARKCLEKTADKNKKDPVFKAAAVAEALQYETGYPDDFTDLRNVLNKGGLTDANLRNVDRMITVGVQLPQDILDIFYGKQKPLHELLEEQNKQNQKDKRPDNAPEPVETADEIFPIMMDIRRNHKARWFNDYANMTETQIINALVNQLKIDYDPQLLEILVDYYFRVPDPNFISLEKFKQWAGLDALLREVRDMNNARKEEASVQWAIDHAQYTPRHKNSKIVRLKIDDVLALQDPDYKVERGNENEIKGRIDKAKDHLEKRPKELEASVIGFRFDGKIDFEDGRHRLIAARELGAEYAFFEIKDNEEQNARLQKFYKQESWAEKDNKDKGIHRQSSSWKIKLASGDEVEVNWSPLWSNTKVDHFEFFGPISTTGYRSHFLNNTLVDLPFNEVEQQAKDIAEKLYQEMQEEINKKNKKEKKEAKESKEYKYHLTLRPFGIGTYPQENFVRFEDDGTPFGVLVYSDKVPSNKISHYSLSPITEAEALDKAWIDDAGYEWQLELNKDDRGAYVFQAVAYDEGQEVDRYPITSSEVIRKISTGEWTVIKKEEAPKEQKPEPEQEDFKASLNDVQKYPTGTIVKVTTRKWGGGTNEAFYEIKDPDPYSTNREGYILNQNLKRKKGDPFNSVYDSGIISIEVVGKGTGRRSDEGPVNPPTPPPPTPPRRPSDYGKNNTLVTESARDAALARLRAKRGNLNFGINPEDMIDVMTIATYHLEAGTRKFVDFARAMIEDLGEWIRPEVAGIYEYARRSRDTRNFAKDFDPTDFVDNFDIDNLNTQDNGLNRPDNSQPDSPVPDDEVPQDGGNVSGNRGGGRGNGGKSSSGNRGGNKGQKGSQSSDDLFADLFGEPSDNEVHNEDEELRPEDDPTGDTDGRGNGTNGTDGVQPDTGAGSAGSTGNTKDTGSFKQRHQQKIKLQKEAEGIEVINADLANIQETLPVLLPEQHDDVLKAETRFFDPKHQTKEKAFGKGMMFTNGTGTGKTYTGLGIIKRFVKRGKDNILIVVPTQPKVQDWADAGKDLNLIINPLPDTVTGGSGIVVTTYANFRENEELLKREFDLVLYDESHRIMEEQHGEASHTTHVHYMMSNKNEDHALRRLKATHPLWKREREIGAILSEPELIIREGRRKHTQEEIDEAQAQLDKYEPELTELREKQREALPAMKEKAKKAVANTKVVFLSATPFKVHFSLRYVNQYLFDWGDWTYESTMRPEDRFYLENFGSAYEWKNGQLQSRSGANAEAISMQEVQFAEKMFADGVISGRTIVSEMDYSREFPKVTGLDTDDFNKAISDIYNYTANEFNGLRDATDATFRSYNYTTQLFEALKVSMTLSRMGKHIAMGRKVVVFHRRRQSDVSAPFRRILDMSRLNAQLVIANPYSSPKEKEEAATHLQQAEAFENKYAKLLEYEQTLDYRSVTDQIADRFGKQAVYMNGSITKKDKNKAIKDFNADESDVKIIVVQEESGKEGISLHDTTGKHQRVLMSMSMPISSITALQIEGRIFRIGQESNAIFEYPLLGLDMEIRHFGSNINRRLSTTENLAVGEQARDLLRSFAEGVLFNSDALDPNEEQGKGGKEYDRKAQQALSEFRRAMLVYQTNQKQRGRRDQRAGIDYFPTPEPLGQKMVEWLDLEAGEKGLEPSAGHGAIAMWFPNYTSVTAIEPSFDLFSKLNARSGGGNRNIQNTTFEEFNIINKFHGIAMNPPFGTGGKLAMEHVEKAFKHLTEGGRLVAIVPNGPSMNRRLVEFLYGTEENGKKKNPTAFLRAEMELPSVTFEQAGTAVNGKIIVLEKHSKEVDFSQENYDFRGSDKIDDFFESIEFIRMPKRERTAPVQPQAQAQPQAARGQQNDSPYEGYKLFEQNDTRNGTKYYMAKPLNDLGDAYRAINQLAKDHNGGYSKYRNKAQNVDSGFQFKTEKDRTEFLEELFNPERGPRFLRVSENGFYSTVEKALEAIPMKKGTVEQFQAMLLKNGAKQAEMDWMDWDDFSKDKKIITKQEVQDWIDQNRINVQEILKSNDKFIRDLEVLRIKADAAKDMLRRIVEQLGGEGSPYISGSPLTWYYKKNGEPTQLPEEYFAQVDRHNDTIEQYYNLLDSAEEGYFDDNIQGRTKWENWKTEGGEHYRELLLTLDVPEGSEAAALRHIDRTLNYAVATEEEREQAVQLERKLRGTKNFELARFGFSSGHWEENNVFAHVRFDERQIGDEKVLFIQEFQADWPQMGRKQGFKEHGDSDLIKIVKQQIAENDQALRETLERMYDMGLPTNPSSSELANFRAYGAERYNAEYRRLNALRMEVRNNRDWFAMTSEMNAIEQQYIDVKRQYDDLRIRQVDLQGRLSREKNSWDREQVNRITDMPFKQTDQWLSLAMRRMIRYAAVKGFDRIAWTNGEMQTERYDLRKQVHTISVEKYKNWVDRNVTIGASGSVYGLVVDPQGIITGYYEDVLRDAKGKHLSEVVGKEMAEKIMEAEKFTEFKGEDLKIGGTGMKAFYDNIVPATASKLGKKFGAKVEPIDLPTNTSNRVVSNTDDVKRYSKAGYTFYFQGEAVSKQRAYEVIENGLQLDAQLKESAPIQSMPITEEMKESVKQGIPLFFANPNGVLEQPMNGATQAIALLQATRKGRTDVHIANKQEALGLFREDLSQKNLALVEEEDFTALTVGKKVAINPDKLGSRKEAVGAWVHENIHAQMFKNIPNTRMLSTYLEMLYDKIGQTEIERVLPKNYLKEDKDIQAEEYMAFVAQKYGEEETFDPEVTNELKTIIFDLINQFTTLKDLQNAKAIHSGTQVREGQEQTGKEDPDSRRDDLQQGTGYNGRDGSKPDGGLRDTETEGGITRADRLGIEAVNDPSKLMDFLQAASEQNKAKKQNAPDFTIAPKDLLESEEEGQRVRFLRTQPLDQILKDTKELNKEPKRKKREIKQVVEGMREFYQDHDLPIRRLEEEIKELGGEITDDTKPFRDMNLSYGRAETLFKKYMRLMMKPILKAVNDIGKKGVPTDLIEPYTIAKHAPERNQYMRDKELEKWDKKAEIKFELWKVNHPKATAAQVNKKEAKIAKARLKFIEDLKQNDYSGITPLDPKRIAIQKEYDAWLKDNKYAPTIEQRQKLKEITALHNPMLPDEYAQAIVDSFEKMVPQNLIDNLWKAIKPATDEIIDHWLDGKELTPTQAAEMRNRYQHYVPLRGWRQGAFKTLTYTKGEGFSGSMQHAAGRLSLADNPLAYIQEVAFKAISEQIENEVKESMFKLMLRNYDRRFEHMYSFKKISYIYDDIEDEWKISVDANGDPSTPPEDMFKEGKAVTKLFSEHQRLRKPVHANEHEVIVRRPTGDVVMVFKDAYLSVAQAMNKQNRMFFPWFSAVTADASAINNSGAIRWMSRFTNFIKRNLTAHNVVFPAVNIVRDVPQAQITGFILGENPVAMLGGLPTGMITIIKDNINPNRMSTQDAIYYKEFLEAGGITGYTHSKSIEEIQKQMENDLKRLAAKGTFKGAMMTGFYGTGQLIEAWNELFENSTRFMVYKSSRKRGKTIREAAYDAKNYTVNFNTKGKITKTADALYAFCNPTIQSLQLNLHLFKIRPLRSSAVAATFFVMGVMEAFLNDSGDDDDGEDDDYYNVNEYVRQNYLIIKPFGKKYIRLPLPPFWRAFKSLGSISYDVYKGKMTAQQGLIKATGNFFASLTPIDLGGLYVDGHVNLSPIAPTIIKPFAEIASNRDFQNFTISKEPFTKEQERLLAASGLAKDRANVAIRFFSNILFSKFGGDNATRFYRDEITLTNGQKGMATKEVNYLADWNASRIDHVLKGIYGGTYKVVTDAVTSIYQLANKDEELDFNNLPFVNAFIRETPEAKWRVIEKYQSLKDDIGPRSFDILNRNYFQKEDKGQFIELRTDAYLNEYTETLKAYEKAIDDVIDGMDLQSAEGSREVVKLMGKCITDIEEVKQKYHRK